jgi:hypothetical protein
MRRVPRPSARRSTRRTRLAGCLAGLALTTQTMAAEPPPPVDDPIWTDRFDEHFRKYAKRYFGPGYDWRWFKSQAIAESTLDPAARSPAGALGLMQILPSTFGDIRRTNPSIKSLRDPRWNIAAGIFYDRQLYKRWGERFGHFDDKLDYTFGSYNAGFGGLSRAYRKAGNPSDPLPWDEVAPHAPAETRNYVTKINGLMTEVQAAREQEARKRAERERLAAEAERQAAEAQSEERATKKPEAATGASLGERLANWLRRHDSDDETAASKSRPTSNSAQGAEDTAESTDAPSPDPDTTTATAEASEPEVPDASDAQETREKKAGTGSNDRQ